MVSHMKTTVQIPDSLFEEARKLANRERTTLKALIEEGLRRIVSQQDKEYNSANTGEDADPHKAGLPAAVLIAVGRVTPSTIAATVPPGEMKRMACPRFSGTNQALTSLGTTAK